MSERPAGPPRAGDPGGLIEIEDSAQLAAVSVALATRCARRLDIVSRHLDPPIYDDEAFVEAVKRLALNSRQARIRLLIVDSRPLLGRGHRLIDLAMRLTSFIEIRAPAPQHQSFNEAMLVADHRGYTHRQFSDRFEGTANLDDPRTAAALAARIDELWERGVPDPNFRRLHL